jgi:hypothetical protein
MSNPYNKIDPLDFLIRKVAAKGSRTLFHIGADDHKAFDMCVFRRHLFDYLAENLQNDFKLWNRGNDYSLELNSRLDVDIMRRAFRVTA